MTGMDGKPGVLRSIASSLALGVSLCTALSGWSQSQSGATGDGLITELSAAFSKSKTVRHVELTGYATWYAGSVEDAGRITLTADSNGASAMKIALARRGDWKESQSPIGSSMSCQWAGNDEAGHKAGTLNCLKSAVWFLPAMSLQPGLVPSGVDSADLGTEIDDSGSHRHLQVRARVAKSPKGLSSQVAETGKTDINIDPVTHLPSVLRFDVLPETGPQTNIPVEIRYSDYRDVDGVEIPFMVQRYVNGSLQLEIRLDSGQID